jgi:hypothetical protein
MQIKRSKCYFKGNAYDAHTVLQHYEDDIKYFENKLESTDNQQFKETYILNLVRIKKHYNQLKNKLKEFEFEIDYSDN